MSKLDEQKTDDQVVGGGVGQDQIDTLTKPVKGHRVLRYRTPKPKGPRTITPLCRTDLLYVAVQVVKKGSETTLHYHTELDGVWMVLSGRGSAFTETARFMPTWTSARRYCCPAASPTNSSASATNRWCCCKWRRSQKGRATGSFSSRRRRNRR